MSAGATRPLPASLPVFPLNGVLLLPRGRLPLNVFEPRYLAMVDDALASSRVIGMIQPASPDDSGAAPALCRTGCAGRITVFAEEDGRYLITLTGLSRFDVDSELATTRGYRRILSDWSPYAHDLLDEAEAEKGIDRHRLIAGLKPYFSRHGLSADWSSLDTTPEERLVTSLAMICPFGPAEKQALLEARDLAARARLLTGLVEAELVHADGRSLH